MCNGYVLTPLLSYKVFCIMTVHMRMATCCRWNNNKTRCENVSHTVLIVHLYLQIPSSIIYNNLLTLTLFLMYFLLCIVTGNFLEVRLLGLCPFSLDFQVTFSFFLLTRIIYGTPKNAKSVVFCFIYSYIIMG